KYLHDKDTIRISFLVKNSEAAKIKETAETYAKEGYNVFSHNCVNVTGKGISVAGLDTFLSPDPKLFSSGYADLVHLYHIAKPANIYDAIFNK
ncbi:MAG: hypothetical protein V4487_06420, partial [Chlamydiota bacterium]